MKISRYLRRVVAGDKVVASGVFTFRNVIVWVFIALVALFLTNPSAGPHSAFSQPVPMPAGAGLK